VRELGAVARLELREEIQLAAVVTAVTGSAFVTIPNTGRPDDTPGGRNPIALVSSKILEAWKVPLSWTEESDH
jgi:hypothetical protein